MEEINYFEEDIVLPHFFDKNTTTVWVIKIANQHQKSINFLNYIFCSDEYLLNINKEYLDHDYYTDIITFPYREDDTLESDIYISIERIKDNSIKLNTTFEEEFYRVIIHGLLHLCGLSDKTETQANLMRKTEDDAINLILTGYK